MTAAEQLIYDGAVKDALRVGRATWPRYRKLPDARSRVIASRVGLTLGQRVVVKFEKKTVTAKIVKEA